MKFSYKSRLIVFFLMPFWATSLLYFTFSFLTGAWYHWEPFLTYPIICFGFYTLYPFIYKKDFSLVFLDGGQKSKIKWRFFMFHTVLWIMLGIFIGLTNYK